MSVKILFIGRTGQLALSLAEVAKTTDVDATFLGRPDIDLADPNSLYAAVTNHDADVVINAGAYTAVDKAESESDLAYAINSEGVRHLAAACAEADRPLVHISTDYVFDGNSSVPYREEDLVAPLGVYGASKHAGEDFVRDICPRHIILRTAWVVSPFGQNFVKTMLRLAETRDSLGVVEDQRGNPTYAPHLAEAIIRMAQRITATSDGDFWGTYNAAGTGEATWCEVARFVFERSAKLGGPSASVRAITTAEYPTPARRPANSRLNCEQLAATFGIRLPDWRDGVTECVQRLLDADDSRTRTAEVAGGKA